MTLTLRSNRHDVSLTIDRTFRPDYGFAELNCGTMEARIEFYEPNLSTLRTFLADLAEHWRGWEGEREWSSCERHIGLYAKHDKLGTVSVTVELRSGIYTGAGPTWRAVGVVLLDSGALEALVREAATLGT